MPRFFLLSILLIGAPSPLPASAADNHAQVPWDGNWRIEAAEASVGNVAGREALYLRNGTVWLDGERLRDGVVRFSLLAGSELGFYGVALRAADPANYEHVYVRPFLSGNPDATQYTPVYNGVSAWQLYADERFAGAMSIAVDRWVTIAVAFRDGHAELRVDDEKRAFPQLQRSAIAGAVGITVAGAPAHIAGVSVSREPPDLDIAAVAVAAADPGPGGEFIDAFAVSTTFAEDSLDPVARLPERLVDGLDWARSVTDVRGIVNLAKTRQRSRDANSVLAGVTLRAESARDVRLRFGFSDRVAVYLDGRPVYRGRNEWRSRDYRFLGTVGLFDEVVLPLRAGDNVLRFAVSEDFGGWGITAALVDAAGVEASAR